MPWRSNLSDCQVGVLTTTLSRAMINDHLVICLLFWHRDQSSDVVPESERREAIEFLLQRERAEEEIQHRTTDMMNVYAYYTKRHQLIWTAVNQKDVSEGARATLWRKGFDTELDCREVLAKFKKHIPTLEPVEFHFERILVHSNIDIEPDTDLPQEIQDLVNQDDNNYESDCSDIE